MRVAVIFNRTRPDTMGIYFLRAFQQLNLDVEYLPTIEAYRLEPRYDLYVRIDDDDYIHPLPSHAHPAIYYLSDVHIPHVFKKVKRYARSFDLLFCPMQPESERLRRMGFEVHWLNPGYDPQIHLDRELPRTTDIAFVGTEGGDPRRFYLQLIREQFPNSFLGPAPFDQMSLIYSRAKIGFSFPIRRECFTMRNFEIMACGALLISPRLRDDSITRSGFCPDQHLVVFDRPKDLLEKLSYFIEHPQEREQIARAGQQQTLAFHSYRHRVVTMLETTSQVCGLQWRKE